MPRGKYDHYKIRGKKLKHKPKCKCFICKAKRREKHPKTCTCFTCNHYKHKPKCKCGVCKAKRGETKGKNNNFYNKKHTKEFKIKMAKKRKGKIYEELYNKKTREYIKSRQRVHTKKKRLAWKRLRIKIAKGEIKLGQKTKKLWKNDKYRQKMRLAKIKWLKENIKNGEQIHPSYNKEACKLINKYGREHGYKFRHAMNGGEYLIDGLGYWVDGYDKKNNIVIEVDEPFHYANSRLREKDKIRQKEITKFLKCKFIRIKFKR